MRTEDSVGNILKVGDSVAVYNTWMSPSQLAVVTVKRLAPKTVYWGGVGGHVFSCRTIKCIKVLSKGSNALGIRPLEKVAMSVVDEVVSAAGKTPSVHGLDSYRSYTSGDSM